MAALIWVDAELRIVRVSEAILALLGGCEAESLEGKPLEKLIELRRARATDEASAIRAALEEHHWRREAAARALNISRTTLWRKMREYSIR